MSIKDMDLNMLFGSTAAEDDDIDKLKTYFFKTNIYSAVLKSDKIKVLRGYKGTGKSAMLKVAYSKLQEENNLCLWIKPDDFINIRSDKSDNSLDMISVWKKDLRELIVQKAYNEFLAIERPEKAVYNTINSLYKMFSVDFPTTIGSISVDEDEVVKKISDKFLKNRQVYIFIDDLDRGWDGSIHSIERISALISAVRDLSNDDSGLKFRLSLRSDMYFLLLHNDSNLDKIENNILNINWTQNDLLKILVLRVQSYIGENLNNDNLEHKSQTDLDEYLKDIMEIKFNGTGNWHDRPIHQILLSLVRERPRDLISLCLWGAQSAVDNNHPKILTSDWEAIFGNYSTARFNDTISEHKNELKNDGVSRLLNGMKQTKNEFEKRVNIYNYDELFQKVKNVLKNETIYLNGDQVPIKADKAMEFLYRIGFIIARKDEDNGYIKRVNYVDDPNLLIQRKGYSFEIHPAFRWALNYKENKYLIETIVN